MEEKKINVLIIEDSPEDAMLTLHELKKAHFIPNYKILDTEKDLMSALKEYNWDVILSDFALPEFNGIEALRLVRQTNPLIPFIFVSGTMGEDAAVDSLHAGANDYVIKGHLKRLPEAITRELEEFKNRSKLKESQERFNMAFNYASIGMALLDNEYHFLQTNVALSQMLGYKEKELLNCPIQERAFNADWGKIEELFHLLKSGSVSSSHIEVRFIHREQHVIWTILNASLVHDIHRNPKYFIVQLQDITAQKLAEEQLKYVASHDITTGLLNRISMENWITQCTDDVPMAVLVFNVDRFKRINESFGYAAGDQILQIVGERLRSIVSNQDKIARMGSDEFALAIQDTPTVREFIQTLRSTLLKPIEIQLHEIMLTVSIGVSFYPKDGHDGRTLLAKANTAMSKTKQAGGDSFQFYSPEMFKGGGSKNVQIELENDLRHALGTSDAFVPYFQPRVDVVRKKIVGAEVLVRWKRNHRKGMVMPSDFIAVAEETGLILPIGEKMLYEACLKWVELQNKKLLPSDFYFAVNLSPRQFTDENLLKNIQTIISDTGMDPKCLEIEITEEVLVKELDSAIRLINNLRQSGIRIAIDDFGVGYSSLIYLKHFNVDRLKIDKTFIQNILAEQSSRSIALAIISLAHNLNLGLTAEGVETQEQVDFLLAHHCDEVQGYFYGAPMPLEDFLRQYQVGFSKLNSPEL